MTNSRRGVEAYGASKSLDAISPDFVNSFRWKNNSAPGCVGVVTLNPRTASILDERRRRREEQQQPSKQHRKEPIVIDHRGIVLSLPPSLFSSRASSFRKRVEGWPKVGGIPFICYLLCARRLSRYYAGASQGSCSDLVARGIWAFEDAQTLGISNYIPRIRVLRSSCPNEGHVSPKSSRTGRI